MQLIVLRARAVCISCRSKLPPRTEVWWDPSTSEATCPTCQMLDEPLAASTVEAPVAASSVPRPPPELSRSPATPDRARRSSIGNGCGAAVPPSAGQANGSVHEPAHSGLLLTSTDDVEADAVVVLDRGDMGEGRIGQTLEAARIHGIEVLHGLRVGPIAEVVDHLIIATNGVWVVNAVPALEGKLERRDVGDWFTANQRLFVADEDRSDLILESQNRTARVASVVQASPFPDVVVRGVLCFESVQPGWVTAPFVLGGIAVTWRRHLVEPMLTPVMLTPATRVALTRYFATNARRH